ncbi:hypothetical protein Acr_05g0008230 [Actinidia rufa]|uniref:Retrovirus-related Pol polyprotein from transposon TNT 1-94-like beta-barrel domain-containing protein n=1 Tax=Actinidia rufa TaxID=165716 RepID=A0A7J0EL40_9ERIC|nr:hypothetical protein Acr_05g0008230 [Actinidia rufa]
MRQERGCHVAHALPRAEQTTHTPEGLLVHAPCAGERTRARVAPAARHVMLTQPSRQQDQSSNTAATAVDNGKSNWVLDSGSAYHLCRDREVFSTYAAYEGRIWMANNTSSRVVGSGSVRFRMADGRSVTLIEWRNSQSFQGKQGDAVGKKTRGLYRLEGNVQTGGATVRHGSSGISEENGQGKQSLHRGTQSKRRVQDIHREAKRKETKSILRSCTAKGATTPKRVSFALDLISGGVLSSSAHKGG